MKGSTPTVDQLVHLRTLGPRDIGSLIDAAAGAAAPADVVVVTPGCIVSAGWFEGLRAAADTDSTVATAGALTTEDVGLAPVETGAGEERLAQLAAAVQAGSPRALPRVLPSGRDCVYVKRSAIELVGGLGSGWSAAGTQPDFYVRCLERGLGHVIADDVIVSSVGPGTAAADARRDAGEVTLARSLSAARRATHRLSLVVDARIVGSFLTGTQVHVIELIGALARTERVGIRALVSNELGGEARRALEALPGVELVDTERMSGLATADLVHRPFQVSSEDDLTLLRRLGERLVVTNQDLIGYRNPSYFSSPTRVERVPPADPAGARRRRPRGVLFGARPQGRTRRRPDRPSPG